MNNTNPREQSLLSKCLYGCADIYGGGAFVVISTFFTVFLTKSIGMPTALAGTIPLIGKVWDAITDPLMGNIVDRTQSRLGAKRFYILVGSIISAITFLLMWIALPSQNQTSQYLFYALMYILFSTGFTIVMVPYNALLPDMVDDYTTRSQFSGVRTFFSALGAIIAGVIPTVLISDNTDAGAYFRVALIFSVIFFISILLTFLGTWERQKPPVKVSFSESFTQSLTVYKSRSFRLFIAIFLCGQGAADFTTGLAVYFVDDVLNAYGGGRFTMLMGVLLIAQLIGMVIFAALMPRTSKKMPIMVTFPIRIVAMLVMLLFAYEGANFNIILFLAFIVGIGSAASSASIYAILSDMADVDELITSINRPGICSAMATFIRKIATGLSSTIIGILLAMVGYNEVLAAAGERQSLATQRGIAYIYVFAPIVLMVATLIFAKLFPMGKKEFDIIKADIARRKGENDSTATEEEKKVCERITGFAYDKLWDRNNALKL